MMVEQGSNNPIELPRRRSLSEDEQSSLRSTLHERAGLFDEDLPIVDTLLKAQEPVHTTDLINALVEQGLNRASARKSIYGIQAALEKEGIHLTNTLVNPERKSLGSTWWIENVEKLLPKQDVNAPLAAIVPTPQEQPSAVYAVDLRDWSRKFPIVVYLSRVEDIFIEQAALALRDCLRLGLHNPIPRIRDWLRAIRQTDATKVTEEVTTTKSDIVERQPQTISPVIQEAQSREVRASAPIITEQASEVEDVQEQEANRFSIQEAAALSLLVASLNNTSMGIDENTVFEFRVDKEVIDICNSLVWTLPFEHGETIKLYAKDYMRLRKGALEKVRDILSLGESEILEIAGKLENEDIENLLVGLAIGRASERERRVWFFDQILQRPEDVAWNDETGYITQLWRESNLGSTDQSSSMVDVIENTLQTDEYLEIIPVDYSKVSSETNGHEVKVSTLERRDAQVREKVRGFIEQIRSLKRIPSLVDGGQLSQYFKPALRASDIDQLLKDGYITPALVRKDIPYYDLDDIVVLLYMRNKPQRIDITGLQKELKRIVAEELENSDSKI